MYPLGTCNGVQDAATAARKAVLRSQPFPNRRSGTRTKGSAGASPHLLGRSPLLRASHCRFVAAPVPHTGGVSFSMSRHCQYLPFLFQTARVEVGRLVKED